MSTKLRFYPLSLCLRSPSLAVTLKRPRHTSVCITTANIINILSSIKHRAMPACTSNHFTKNRVRLCHSPTSKGERQQENLGVIHIQPQKKKLAAQNTAFFSNEQIYAAMNKINLRAAIYYERIKNAGKRIFQGRRRIQFSNGWDMGRETFSFFFNQPWSVLLNTPRAVDKNQWHWRPHTGEPKPGCAFGSSQPDPNTARSAQKTSLQSLWFRTFRPCLDNFSEADGAFTI